MDRRADQRFTMNVPVRFMWKLPDGLESGKGRTRDISLRGVFVLADTCPKTGSEVRVNVLLPSGSLMRAKATVTRVEAMDDPEFAVGFAAVTRRYILENRQE
jgi:hypothetical protein